MQFSDEELISFLLGDASQSLVDGIKQQLEFDAELIERLSHLRMVLGHMDSLCTHYEPPADLMGKTLARIDAEAGIERLENSNKKPAKKAVTHILQPAADPPRQRRNLWDSTALTVSLSLLCCLALPALVGARFEARKAQCAQNLRLTGMGLIDYSSLAPDGRFPQIATSGPSAFAGVYAIHLNEAGLLDSIQQLRCPSLSSVNNPVSNLQSSDLRLTGQPFANDFGLFPSLSQLGNLPPNQLRVWQLYAGGDYAYNLGVIEDSRAVAPRNSGRSYFAILGDSPVLKGKSESFDVHDGRGINILYEDGRVQFLSLDYLCSLTSNSDRYAGTPARSSLTQDALLRAPQDHVRASPAVTYRGLGAASLLDHPFRNTNGEHQVGLNPQDASLAPSHFTPLGTTIAR
jgi:hypothetical protein